MPGKRCAMVAVMVGVLSMTGCCRWCDRNCPNCHAPQSVAYPAATCQPCYQPAAPVAAVPAPVSYAPPAPVQAQYQRPTCTCTCN